MSVEIMKQALAKFESLWEIGIDAVYRVELLPEIQALRQAIEQAEKQEPVAYLCENAVGHKYFRWKKPTSHYKPIALYIAPPQREWQGLTDEDIGDVYVAWDNTNGASFADFARLIEAKLKDKNG